MPKSKPPGISIDKVASASGTSGKPYLIRFKDGRESKARNSSSPLKKIEPKL